VWAVDGIFGDLVFEERACDICGEVFIKGEEIILVVKGTSDNGTHTVPAHRHCMEANA